MNRKHHQHHASPQASGRPLRTRVFVLAVLLVCGGAATISLFEQKELPQALRDNPAVESAYKFRDRVIAKGEAWMQDDKKEEEADAKQHGYNKDDRKKLDALISKGAQEH